MKFKIREEHEGLCYSCENAMVMTDVRGRERILCENVYPPTWMPVAAAECSAYEARGRLTKRRAFEIGWVMDTRQGKIGFRPPKKTIEDD